LRSRIRFSRLSGLNLIANDVSVSVSLVWVSEWESMDTPSETTKAGEVHAMQTAERAPGRNNEPETGALLIAPRTLVVCEP
jgi:hypothetical protein